MRPRRCVFIGDEPLTIQCAELALGAGFDVAAVLSTHPYGEEWSTEHGVHFASSEGDLHHTLRHIPFDVLFSIAYLRLIPDEVLGLAEFGVNFHDGPLPGYAGLNVTNWALLNGETDHAITWHMIDSGIDDGAVVLSASFPIDDAETALSLNARCYEAALETFPAILEVVATGVPVATEQPPVGRRVYRRHERPAGTTLLDPERPAASMDRLVRAFEVGPRQRGRLGMLRLVVEGTVYLVSASRAEPSEPGADPGSVSATIDPSSGDEVLRITTGVDDLSVTAVTDTNGRPVAPSLLVERHPLLTRSGLPPLPAGLASAFERLDAPMARAEDRIVERLTSMEPTQVPPLAAQISDGGERERDTTTSEHGVRVDLPEGFDGDLAIAVVATWLARRTGRADAVFELATAQLAASRRELAPLCRLPLVQVHVPPDATADDLVATVARIRAEAERDGVWLSDLVARDPALRTRPPGWAEILVSVGAPEQLETTETVLHFAVGDGRIAISGRNDRVDIAELARLRDELLMLIAGMGELPGVPLRKLPMAAKADDSLLATINDTSVPHDDIVTIDELFRRRVGLQPDSPALTFDSEQLTYAELSERAAALAVSLRDAGVEPGSRVGIALPRSIDLVTAVLATLECGAAYVPLDPTYPLDRLLFMAEDAELALLVGSDRHGRQFGDSGIPILDPTGVDPVAGTSVEHLHGGRDLAYVIYTSGSSGTPKGVMLEHRQVTNFFEAMDAVVDHDDPGVWLAVTSLSFDISVLELLWTLTRGFHVVLKPDGVGGELSPGSPGPSAIACPTFSLFYFAAAEGEPDGYRLLLEGARYADTNDLEAVWVPERHFHEFGGIYPNPAVLASAVAATTTRVGIRAGSCVIPLHHPARVAEEWSVVDNLSGGRVGIAAAAGWQPDDFVLQPANYEDARQAMLDGLETIERLWRGESARMEGPAGPVDIRTFPRPVQQDLPLWITSAGSVETFAIAGSTGRNVLTHLLGQSIAQLEAKIDAYRDARRRAGWSGDGHVTLMLHTYLHEDGDVARAAASPRLRDYLGSATGLLKDVASSFPTLRGAGTDADEMFASLDADQMDQLLGVAVERYIGTSGLIGDLDDGLEMVRRVAGAGVDEIACLIDFGIATDDVLASLPLITALRERSFREFGDRDGAEGVLGARAGSPPSGSVADLVRRHGCTHLQCTPSLAAMLVADPDDRAALGSIQHLLVGGEALPTSLAKELRAVLPHRFTNMYGPTETTIWSLCHEIEGVGAAAVPIGRPIANTAIAILDEFGTPVPVGCFGELHIGGAGVARGYFRRPELTAERFDDVAPLGRAYATGDIVRLLPDGEVEFAGREDFQVKIRGHRVELGEIESCLDEHPDVVRSVVTVVEPGGQARLAAYVSLHDGAGLDPDGLKRHVGDHLPAVMVPDLWVEVDRFPLTPNGKIDRRALPSPKSPPGRSGVAASAANDRERLVAEAWQQALGHGVGRDDNFFDVGGNSLLAVKVFRGLSDDTGLRISLTDVFRHPTVRSFAAHLDALEGLDNGDTPDEHARTGSDRGALRRRARQRGGTV